MADRVPSWLAARPSVRVLGLQGRNLWRRWPLPVVAAGCAVLALAALGRVRAVIYVIALAALSPRAVLVVAAVIAATVALRHQSRLRDNWHRHWLAALPADVSLTVRTAARPAALCLAVAALIVLVSLVAQLPAWVPATLVGYCVCGVVLGVVLASAFMAVSARRGQTDRPARALPHSRYASARAAPRVRRGRVSLRPLGDWPRADTRFRDRSTIRARSLVLLLLLVPMGAAAGPVLAAAAAWLIVLHLINLLVALARTALSASWWLAPTPLGPMRFAAALSHRILGAQLLASALLIAIGSVVLGPQSLRMGCALAVLWLAAVGVFGTAVCAAALRSRSIAASALHRWPQ